MKLKEIEALIEPALLPGESIEDFLRTAVEARAGKDGALPSDDLSNIPTAKLIDKTSEFYKHPARLPNLIPRCILAISRWNDTASENERISPTNSVIAQLGNIRPNDLKDWMPAYAAHVQEQDEQWGLSQFTNRSINTRLGPTDKEKGYPGYLAAELIPKIELPKNGGASPKLQAA